MYCLFDYLNDTSKIPFQNQYFIRQRNLLPVLNKMRKLFENGSFLPIKNDVKSPWQDLQQQKKSLLICGKLFWYPIVF